MITDALGVEVRVGDTVTVIAWGAPIRLADTGRTVVVTGTTARGNLTHDTDVANGRALTPRAVAVARRDGEPGHEGNRKHVCTCGAVHYSGCFCNLSLSEFLASPGERRA